MGITVKQATQEDAPFLARMILKSSRAGKKVGLFDFLFDLASEDEILQKLEMLAQTESKSHCHYKNFLIAQLDGENAGTLCSYEPRISNQETFLKAIKEIECCETADNILEAFYNCNFNVPKSTLMFDFMEELPGLVDVGILKALMQKSLLTARLKGYRRAQTIIEIGSLESEMLYKKLGFRVVQQKECEEYRETFGRSGIMLLEIEF